MQLQFRKRKMSTTWSLFESAAVVLLIIMLGCVRLHCVNRTAKIYLSKDPTVSKECISHLNFSMCSLNAFCLRFSFKLNRYGIISPFLPQAGLH